MKCAFCKVRHSGDKTLVFENWDVYSLCDTCFHSPRKEFFYSQWVKRMDYVRRSRR